MSKIIGITAATPTKGGDGVDIIIVDSVEDLPQDAPENTIALAPCEVDPKELEQQVAKHTNQINLIGNEIATINKAIGDDKDDLAEVEQRVAEIERDHGNNTGFVMMMGGLAENPVNDGKVLGIKDETIVAMDAPSGGGGVGFQMVEITIGVDTLEDGSTLNTEKCAELNALAQAKMPILLKVIEPAEDANPEIGTIEICPFAYVGEEQFVFGGSAYMIIGGGGIWMLMHAANEGAANV